MLLILAAMYVIDVHCGDTVNYLQGNQFLGAPSLTQRNIKLKCSQVLV